MADRGIIFSAPMVLALLAGRKTQTRRILKLPPAPDRLGEWQASTIGGAGVTDRKGRPVPEHVCAWHTRTGAVVVPRHLPGDRLYVRESVRGIEHEDTFEPSIEYQADEAVVQVASQDDLGSDEYGQWWNVKGYASEDPDLDGETIVPSIHMPRWASRLTLHVEAVKVERVQGISEADAIAEGVELYQLAGMSGWVDYLHDKRQAARRYYGDPRESFRTLWQSLHTKPGERWDDNPFVVALTFRVERGNIDRLGSAA